MKKKTILGTLLMFLIIGTAYAVNISDLKVPIGYNEETEGYYYLNTDEHTHLYIGKMSENEDAFTSDVSLEYMVVSAGDNLYELIDDGMKMYGIQEKVNIDGTDYLVSIDKDTPLSNTDKTMFIEDLKDFNKLNNLKPVKVDI